MQCWPPVVSDFLSGGLEPYQGRLGQDSRTLLPLTVSHSYVHSREIKRNKTKQKNLGNYTWLV